MTGNLAKIIMKTYPDIYCKYVTVKEKGENMLYIKALNAIYVIMKAAHIFLQETCW